MAEVSKRLCLADGLRLRPMLRHRAEDLSRGLLQDADARAITSPKMARERVTCTVFPALAQAEQERKAICLKP